ncbi:MAG: hypothetical protein JWO38_2785 [Gemmataceae bacterium]|nr:hypothetical protein [Gemmataceae bacterium]
MTSFHPTPAERQALLDHDRDPLQTPLAPGTDPTIDVLRSGVEGDDCRVLEYSAAAGSRGVPRGAAHADWADTWAVFPNDPAHPDGARAGVILPDEDRPLGTQGALAPCEAVVAASP